MKFSKLQINTLIAIAAAIFFIPFLGAVHLFDWDEVNFAECAREMLATHDYFTVRINFQPFWEKPPFFIWMSAGSMKLFGVNEFATRLPNAICGIVTLILTFNIGTRLYDRKMGLLWTLCYAGSTLPQFYFKTGIIDPWFNLFIFSGIYFFIRFSNTAEGTTRDLKSLIFSALFIGLAVLTKGPVAVLIVGLCIGVYLVVKRFKNVISIPQIILYGLVVASVGGLWFLMLFLTGKASIISEFFNYQVRLFQTQDAGHGGPFLYHFVVLFLGCFPASVFTIRSFKRNTADTPLQKHFKLWMLILFWVVLLLFSIVKTKIIHYSSLCYFPLTFLAAYSVYHIMNGTLSWKKWMNYLLFISGGIVALALSLLPFFAIYKEKIIASGMIHDVFFTENLKADVHWSGWEALIGLVSLATIIIAVVLARKKKYRNSILTLFIGNFFVIQAAALIIAPKIEQYTQGAAIEFYQSLQNKPCYVETYGFKSYAKYFYSQKQLINPNSCDIDWLLRGPIDHPAYFVCKITSDEEVKRIYPELKEFNRKNGYIFYVRTPLPENEKNN